MVVQVKEVIFVIIIFFFLNQYFYNMKHIGRP